MVAMNEKNTTENEVKNKSKPAAKSWRSTIADKSKSFGIVLLLITTLGLGYAGGWLATRPNSGSQSQITQQIVLNESELISKIVQDVGPSVVSINVRTTTERLGFFGFTSPVEQESAGTGVIISKDGYVLTNRHVVSGDTSNISITLSDGTELDDVKLVGRTNANDPLDIAFLKINDTKGKDLTAAKLADSSTVNVGDKAIAIGNALGQFQNTVTAGIISGYGRDLTASGTMGGDAETLQNLFQTDAAINEGNSGGPLVNINGEVVGINTAIAGGSAQNIGFAIPINDIKGMVASVLEKGKIERPYLGIRYISLTDDYAYLYNLSVNRGAYIAPTNTGSSILAGSPAEKAGLKEKDIITKINDVAVDENNSLTSLVGKYAVGEEVTLTIIRDGNEQTLRIKLEAAPTE